MKVKVSYKESEQGPERLRRATEILSEGVYTYLKDKGLLKENLEVPQEVRTLLESQETEEL